MESPESSTKKSGICGEEEKGYSWHTAIAQVVVEEKLVGRVELLTVSGGGRSFTPMLLSYTSL